METPISKYAFGNITWYGLIIAIAILIALAIGTAEEKRKGLPKDSVIDFAIFAIPISILGARLYYVLFTWSYYKNHLSEILHIWEGGLAIFGGILAGIAVMIAFTKKRKINLPQMLDALSPGLVLAQALGRWGNYFNMEAYGKEVFNKSLQFFPLAVAINNNGIITWHRASFFYESVWDMACFVVLWLSRKHIKKDGDSFLIYLICYGAGRAVIEGMRTDSLYIGGMRVSQIISIIMCLAVLIVFILRTGKKWQLGMAALYAISIIMLLISYNKFLIIPTIILILMGTLVLSKLKANIGIIAAFIVSLLINCFIYIMVSNINYAEIALSLMLFSLMTFSAGLYTKINN